MNYKVSIKDVMNDDPNSPFWQTIMSNPEYAAFEQDLDYILKQSNKHGKPFKDIESEKLDPYDWKLK